MERTSKRVLWEIMLQLDEAGEEDLCSLLNEVMGLQPYFGSGTELTEYLDAITVLEAQGELRVRAYQIQDGKTVFGDVLVGPTTRPPSDFSFDSGAAIWRWKNPTRRMVDVPSVPSVELSAEMAATAGRH